MFENPNYKTACYLRAQLADGSVAWIRPAEIAASGAKAPVRFALGHPLLDAFAIELLIALFQHTAAPESEDAWYELWERPPGVAELDAAFAASADGFDLFGAEPAFQDPTAADAEPSPVGRLLPTTAGEQGRKRNQDIFLPEITAMRPEVAMLALAFVQAHSPAGGRGTRTSLTGGGPLRTWVEAADDTVYRTVLANLIPRDRFTELGTGDGIDPLPWRARLTGKRTAANTPAEHMLFACPRRILLARPEGPSPGRACDVTGDTDVPLITAIHQKADGPDYDSTGWRHALTPYIYRKTQGTMVAFPRLAATLPVGSAWRERAGLFASVGGPGTEGPVPASIVDLWRRERAHYAEATGVVRVRAFGLRCDNAKVMGIADGHFTFRAAPKDRQDEFDAHANALVELGQRLSGLLRTALREAAYSRGERDKLGYEVGSEVVSEFWTSTEAAFNGHLTAVADALEAGSGIADPPVAALKAAFLGSLRRRVLALFDERCEHLLTGPDPARAAEARRRLRNFSAALIAPRDATARPRRRRP